MNKIWICIWLIISVTYFLIVDSLLKSLFEQEWKTCNGFSLSNMRICCFSRFHIISVASIAIFMMTLILKITYCNCDNNMHMVIQQRCPGLTGPVFIWSPMPPSTHILSIIYVPPSEVGSLAFFFQTAVDIAIMPLSWICLATMIV